jgi:hypothetical protein
MQLWTTLRSISSYQNCFWLWNQGRLTRVLQCIFKLPFIPLFLFAIFHIWFFNNTANIAYDYKFDKVKQKTKQKIEAPYLIRWNRSCPTLKKYHINMLIISMFTKRCFSLVTRNFDVLQALLTILYVQKVAELTYAR